MNNSVEMEGTYGAVEHCEQKNGIEYLAVFFLLIGGVDGFLPLEFLRELGSRPFFLLWPIVLGIMLARRQATIDLRRIQIGLVIVFLGTIAFALFGAGLKPFANKEPFSQFLSHSFLFVIGFICVVFQFDIEITEAFAIRVAQKALFLAVIFAAVDFLFMSLYSTRPFAGVFLADGAITRFFPTGLFSEPSYFAAYCGILLPVAMLRAKPVTILFWSALFGAGFFWGNVRSFFMVYGTGMFCLLWVRWGISKRTLLCATVIAAMSLIVASQLNLMSVEDSLSSAYRLGNAYSYLLYALKNCLILGDGFGSSHFLYPALDFPGFMFYSDEFQEMLSGGGDWRVPVFNEWVRLAVELGVMPTLVILWGLFALAFSKKTSAYAKVFFFPAFSMTLSTDSYIYGMWTIALLLIVINHQSHSKKN